VHLEADKENGLPTLAPPAKKPYTSQRGSKEKLETIFWALAEVNWMLAEFLYQPFWTRDEHGEEIHCMDHHAKYAQHFIRGTGKYTAGMILECWLKSPDGRLSNVSESATDLMYSTASTPYTDIKNVHMALTSFAVQIVHKKLIAEAKQAVKLSSGLHASAKKKATQQVEWSDIGRCSYYFPSSADNQEAPAFDMALYDVHCSARNSRWM
jgi:hypothetical protein